MAKEEAIELEGVVTEVLPNATFRVRLDNGHDVLSTLAGRMRRFRIRVLAADRVTDPAPMAPPASRLVPKPSPARTRENSVSALTQRVRDTRGFPMRSVA